MENVVLVVEAVDVPRRENCGEDIICIENRHAFDDDHVNTISDSNAKEIIVMVEPNFVIIRPYSGRHVRGQ